MNSYEWSKEDTKAAKEFFYIIDKNGNGVIDSEEIVVALGAHNNLLGSSSKTIDLNGFIDLLKDEAHTIPPLVPYETMLKIASRTMKVSNAYWSVAQSLKVH